MGGGIQLRAQRLENLRGAVGDSPPPAQLGHGRVTEGRHLDFGDFCSPKSAAGKRQWQVQGVFLSPRAAPSQDRGARGAWGVQLWARGLGRTRRGRDSAPGAVATRATAPCKEPLAAKYSLTSLALLTAPTGSKVTVQCHPQDTTIAVGHHCGCHHSHAPPRMLCQHPSSSPMAGPQGSGPEHPRHGSQEPRRVPSPAGALGHSVSGRTRSPVPAQIRVGVLSPRLQRCTHFSPGALPAPQCSAMLP